MISFHVVIVNWNSGDQLRKCLASINSSDKGDFSLNEVVVVDNDSKDGSQIVTEELAFSFRLIQNKQNKGFAYACNQGASINKSSHIIFLNPDTIIFKNTLSLLAKRIESLQSNIGIVGIALLDDKNNISTTCSYFPRNWKKLCKILGLNKIFPTLDNNMVTWKHNTDKIVDQVMGAFFVVKSELYSLLNGFDTQFFVYYEEVDFCKRAKNKGYLTYFCHDVQAYHKGGGTSEQVLDRRLFYSLNSYLKYQKKHNKILGCEIAFILILFEYISRRILLLIKGEKRKIVYLNNAYKMLFQKIHNKNK